MIAPVVTVRPLDRRGLTLRERAVLSALRFLRAWYRLRRQRKGVRLLFACHRALERLAGPVSSLEYRFEQRDLVVAGPLFDPRMALVFFQGVSEPDMIDEVRRRVPPNGVVVDVGALHGTHTIAYARQLVPSGHVYALEPVPESFHFLERNVRLNELSNVTCVPVGLSNGAGDRPLSIPGADAHPRYATTVPWGRTAGLMSVHAKAAPSSHDSAMGRFTTLDDFVERQQLRSLDFLKVDVEGHELAVLEGGLHALRRHRPVMVMEFNAVTSELAGVSALDLLAMLRRLEYQPLVKNASGQTVRLEERMLSDGSFAHGNGIPFLMNILLVPPTRQREGC